jgi:hypothetical protein
MQKILGAITKNVWCHGDLVLRFVQDCTLKALHHIKCLHQLLSQNQ